MKTETNITKSLICELTEKERENYGIELATTLQDMDDVEVEKKRNADHFKDRLGGLQSKADELRRKVSSGQEWRDVKCEVRLSEPDADHKQVVRLDTGSDLDDEGEPMPEADDEEEGF